ncbi:MAG: Crp/Fnr family transcriptional regulator [Pseudomonadales bacterium]
MNTSHRPTRDWIRTALNRSSWFTQMPEDMRQELLSHGVVRHFPNGAHILEQGCHPDGIYAVLEGQVAFLRQVVEGREFLLNIVGPGYWFADPSILLGEPMPHTAVARADVQVLFVPATITSRIRNARIEFTNHFARMHAQRFIIAINGVADAATLSREAFLRQRLADLATQMGLTDAPGSADSVEVAVSQSELALLVGVSRQTLNGYLSDLECRGLIEIGYRSIRLHQRLLAFRAAS